MAKFIEKRPSAIKGAISTIELTDNEVIRLLEAIEMDMESGSETDEDIRGFLLRVHDCDYTRPD